MNKLNSYIGFARKSGACVLGVDNLLKSRAVKIVFASPCLKENSLSKLKNRFGEVLFVTPLAFETLSPSVLAFGITDLNLADACFKIIKKTDCGQGD